MSPTTIYRLTVHRDVDIRTGGPTEGCTQGGRVLLPRYYPGSDLGSASRNWDPDSLIIRFFKAKALREQGLGLRINIKIRMRSGQSKMRSGQSKMRSGQSQGGPVSGGPVSRQDQSQGRTSLRTVLLVSLDMASCRTVVFLQRLDSRKG